MKKKKKFGKIGIIAAVVLVIAVIVVLFSQSIRERFSIENGAAGTGTEASGSTAQAYLGDIRLVTEGSGSIEGAKEQTVKAEYGININQVQAEEGDVVAEGEILASIDRDSIQTQIDQLEEEVSALNTKIREMDKSGSSSLSAPVSGRVKRIYARSGDLLTEVMTEHGGIMELSVDGKLKVVITPDTSLKIGSDVTVSFLSYEEDGIVSSEKDGAYTITLEDASNYQVDTEAVVSDENGKVLGSGYLASNHPYLVEGMYGIMDELNVDIGDYVDSGATLLSRTSYSYNGDYLSDLEERETKMEQLQELRTLYQNPVITAAGSGIVSDLMLKDNTAAAVDAPMYSLISTEEYWLKAEIDELDIAGVEEGQPVTVVFDAFDSEEYEGRVKKVSAVGHNVNGVTTYTVTISLAGTDDMKLAMSATAKIITAEKKDALLVPVDAILTSDGQKYVTKADGTQVPVTLGLVNNTEAEILEGISEGDTVTLIDKETNLALTMMKMSNSARGNENNTAGTAAATAGNRTQNSDAPEEGGIYD
ncbi:MAG: HlyD family efflux transporter periplasmic adaptor subunit [Lachnospiraceae bacterium]|nr:HlyD family efflux transporter periplasmic adaptor subunit [Lachnospiraceae bacterium]